MDRIKTMTILQHNVKHWNSKKYELCNIYRTIDPDIILLNEHGQKETEHMNIFNYNIHKSNKTGEINDGVAIAIRKNLSYKLIDNFNEEAIAIKLQTSIGEIIVGTFYLPPRRPYLPANDLVNLINYNRPVYIIGDFNARHRIFGHNNNNTVGNSLQTIINSGKLIHIGPNFKTFIGNQRLTTPDRVFSNNKAALNYHLQQGPVTTSDHIPIIMKLSTSPIQIQIKERYSMKKANWLGYKTDLEDMRAPDLNNKNIEEIDKELELVHDKIIKAMEKNIPRTRYKTLPHPPINEETRYIQTQFNNIHTYIEINGPDLYTINRIKQLQVQLQQIYRRNKNEEWNKLLNNINETDDSKTFWRQINQAEGKEYNTTPYVKDTNGNKIYENDKKETAFRNIWSQVFTITEEENENYDQDHENTVKEWMQDKINDIIPNETVELDRIPNEEKITEAELLHSLRKFKEKTPGITGITKNVLMNLPQTGIDALLNLYNASLSAGYFPDELKKTKMIFIPKDGKDKKEIFNYRPISLLEITGKLLEKILNNRLLTYLENNNALNMRQHGFRKHRGTHTALAIITDTIARAKSNKDQVNLITRDIKKAFDKVWHLGLKYKILRTTLPTFMKKILCDYLTDRKIHIQIGDYLGPPFEIESGVPQGGCLSPTLFIFYTSDMPQPTPYSDYVAFADDVTQIVAYPGKSKEFLALHTKNAIENINQYEKKWKIQTNSTKFKIIPIGRNNSVPVVVDDEVYEYSNEGMVLGLKITKTGYKSFLKEKINKLNNIHAKLYKFIGLSPQNKRKLYMALIRSILEYPPIPQIAMKKSNINSLQVIQNKALRFIYNVKYPEIIGSDELHNQANLPKIKDLLTNRATDIWEKISKLELNFNLYELTTNYEGNTQNNWFPISYR